ncbi:hypothetical protein [Ancylobacter aquaticus]|uniref:hypothetical protein n=1 Tax=Ancylobacter aquaticus TaxID=100 RepID=UPI001048CC79|nr:hypothetical protein [Ancylobacter aquaticus]
MHERTSPTVGGRNTKDRQREGALDLDKAAKRDRNAFEKAMAGRDSDKNGLNMNSNIKMIYEYIGENIEILLNDEPFKNYKFTLNVENDIPNYLYMYVCEKHGFEFQCDEDKRITSIFVSRESDLSDRLDVRIDWDSHEVRHRLGVPTKSGKIWDRFDLTKYALHVSYGKSNLIEMITLMRNDVIPQG